MEYFARFMDRLHDMQRDHNDFMQSHNDHMNHF